MAKVDFTLFTPLEGTLTTGPEPEEVAVPRTGCSELTEPGKTVVIGEKIASSNRPNGCDIHSPICGTVTEMDENEIRIRNNGEKRTVEPLDLTRFEGPGLLEALRLMGANTGRISSAQTLIINGVDPEPGITVHHRLAAEHHKTLRTGVSVLQKGVRPAETLFAVPKEGGLSLLGNSFVWVDPIHPAGMPQLIAHAATGRENPRETLVISAQSVWQIGRIAESGLPVTETVLTVQGKDFRTAVGTMAGDLLAAAGETPTRGDRVVMGGPMTGLPARSLKQGTDRDTMGVTLIPRADLSGDVPHPCLGCGECVMACPARLRPDLIAAYAEFSLFEKAWALDADICFECGLCAYHCPARRPLLQYIVLAKREQERAREQALQNG